MSTPHTTPAPRNAPPLTPFAPGPRAGARSLARPDGTLAYDDTGTGPLVVMLPGLGDLRQGYRFLAPHLVGAGYRAVSADLRGHGDSSTNWPDYGSEAAGHDLVALIEELGGGRAVVVGNSFGAAPAARGGSRRGAGSTARSSPRPNPPTSTPTAARSSPTSPSRGATTPSRP